MPQAKRPRSYSSLRASYDRRYVTLFGVLCNYSRKPLKIETISLAHNGLTSGRMMSTMAHYLPGLKNLSLEGNSFRGWKELDYISGKRGRLQQLRELILVGNPIRELEYQNNRAAGYKSYRCHYLPIVIVLIMLVRLRGGSHRSKCSTERL